MTARARRWSVHRPPGARFLVFVSMLLLTGCASAPSGLPPDVPRPDFVRVVTGQGFRLCIDGACLDQTRERALFDELAWARDRLVAWLGPARAPGDFRLRGEVRPLCPPGNPAPLPARIDVVVVQYGDRCHADRDGITLLESHLPRRDATHELAHFLAGSSWRPIDEGLAVYLTDHLWGPANGVPLKVRARVFLELGVADDLKPDTMYEEGMSRKDYDIAGAFVGWLIEAYGKERFFSLYSGPERNFHPVYDMGELELWDRFRAFLRNLDVRHDGPYHKFMAKMTGE